jgi:hypothetical protein
MTRSNYTGDMLKLADEQKFLFVPAAAQLTIFQYKTEQARRGLPAIVLAESPQHVEVACLLTHAALLERAKIHIAARFLLASMPCSLILVNDKRMLCTRLSFSEGQALACWLVNQLSNPVNLKIGEFSERNHDRIECRLRSDGSIWAIAGAHHLGREANKRKAA